MMLTSLATIARRTGYPVIEVAGWKTRGRPGGMFDIRTITVHHTANGGAPGNFPSLRVVRDGRLRLPGPLAQYGLGVDGTIYVVAAGKCNHAGVSLRVEYTNPHAIGIEAEAEGVPGDPQDWPPRQRESYVRLCRALVDEFPKVLIRDVRGHKETAAPPGRKSDPTFNMTEFRRDVASCDLSQPPKEIPHMIDDKDVTKIAKAVGALPIANKNPDAPDGAPSSLAGSIVDLERTQDANTSALARIEKAEAVHHAEFMDALGKLTAALADTGDVPPPVPE
jgi:hypothetical protein